MITFPISIRLQALVAVFVVSIAALVVAALMVAKTQKEIEVHTKGDSAQYIDAVVLPAIVNIDASESLADASGSEACAAMKSVSAEMNAILKKPFTNRQVSADKLVLSGETVGLSCSKNAKRLAHLLDSQLERDSLLNAIRDGANSVKPGDFQTRSAWRLSPGCITIPDGTLGSTRIGQRCVGNQLKLLPWTELMSDNFASSRVSGVATKYALTQAETVQQFDHTIVRGHDVKLTIDLRMQDAAEKIVACMTQTSKDPDASCKTEPLTPFAAIVVIDMDTGGVVTASGAWSACAKTRLRASQPRNLAVPDNQPCAVRPDARDEAAQHLFGRPPWSVLVPTGSFAKLGAGVAGLRSGAINPGNSKDYQQNFSVSENLPFQRLAGERPSEFSAAINALFREAPKDYMTGHLSLSGYLEPSRANTRLPDPQGLLSSAVFERIHREKLNTPRAANAKYRAIQDAYDRTNAYRQEAIGARSASVSAIGIADIIYNLQLSSDGKVVFPAMHLMVVEKMPPENTGAMFPTKTSKDLIGLLSRVSAGSGAPACGEAGSCASVLWGKTGTNDFLATDKTRMKRGASIPSKVFGALIQTRSGKKYAVGAVALRQVANQQVLDVNPAAILTYRLTRALDEQAEHK